MKRNAKRILLLLLALALLATMTACRRKAPAAEAPAPTQTQAQEQTPADEQSPAQPQTAPEDDESAPAPDEDGRYYDVESVARYLAAYGHLPSNYLTKNEARKLGWSGGSVEQYRDGAAIGGDRFGNREGLLPDADGRVYTECDIDTLGRSSRGAKRLIFSNDGLFFYTEDHYESFRELTVSEKGDVQWK